MESNRKKQENLDIISQTTSVGAPWRVGTQPWDPGLEQALPENRKNRNAQPHTNSLAYDIQIFLFFLFDSMLQYHFSCFCFSFSCFPVFPVFWQSLLQPRIPWLCAHSPLQPRIPWLYIHSPRSPPTRIVQPRILGFSCFSCSIPCSGTIFHVFDSVFIVFLFFLFSGKVYSSLGPHGFQRNIIWNPMGHHMKSHGISQGISYGPFYGCIGYSIGIPQDTPWGHSIDIRQDNPYDIPCYFIGYSIGFHRICHTI